jgi:phosphotransferase system HPr (HPr) family protein
MPTASKDVIIINERGLHARPAMEFVDIANRFKCDVKVTSLGEERLEVDGKSIMQMMTLAAVQGTPLRIEAEGEDAEAAVDQLAALIERKFGEE